MATIKVYKNAVVVKVASIGLQGPRGLTGDQGIQGVQGIQGIQGETGPVGVTDSEKLKWWANSGSYTLTSATRDSDGVITVATVAWPDGSTGTFTTMTKNSTFLVIDAYTVTHATFAKTVTQSAVTRDVSGNITAQPALTITP